MPCIYTIKWVRILLVYKLIEPYQCITIDESTRINFGSCNHQDHLDYHADTWKSIVSRDPDLWIWTGDAVYLDHYNVIVSRSYPYSDYNILLYAINAYILGESASTDPTTWPHKYASMQKNVMYQKLKKSTPIIGIYDDHDIGLNNADFKFQYKNISQHLFLDFLDVCQNDSKRSRPGVYDHYEMKNEINVNNITYHKTIDIILLDIRYFARQDGAEDILGETQWKWLQDTLENKLNGELLIVVSGIQMMSRPPLHTIEGWYKFQKSQQKLFRLLKQYNTNDRLLLVSGDVHRAEMMHSQCIGNETYDFYEVTSSGITHSVFLDTPMIERFTYALDNYAREDGVMGCNWLGRNFGEININWQYNVNKNSVEIKNVSVEILDANGDVKCKSDLPLFGYSDMHSYDDDSHNLWSNKFHTCYGAETFHSDHGVASVRTICGLSWLLLLTLPNTFLLLLCFLLLQLTAHYCCSKFDIFGIHKAPPLSTRSMGARSIHRKNPASPVRNALDDVGFPNHKPEFEFSNSDQEIANTIAKQATQVTQVTQHVPDPSLINPNGTLSVSLNRWMFHMHSHSYYQTYGYLLFKNVFYFYFLITIIFVMGFKLLGPYNSEYTGNLYVLISFGIMYCCWEICLGYHCVYSFRIAKYLTIVTCCISAICMIISWIHFKEILISVLLILADSIGICSSVFIISHGFMNKIYILIILFQIIVVAHKLYSLGSHLIYIHNDVPLHTNVGWFWLIQICLMKIYLSQFIFRAKLQYITDILYDNLLIVHEKYRQFEILFAILLFAVFCMCFIQLMINTNEWDEGYVSVGTYLEFSFMFNWPSAIFYVLWLGLKHIKIPKKHQMFEKQLSFKRVSAHIGNISLQLKHEFSNITAKLFDENNLEEIKEEEIGYVSPVKKSIHSRFPNTPPLILEEDTQQITEQTEQTENKIEIEMEMKQNENEIRNEESKVSNEENSSMNTRVELDDYEHSINETDIIELGMQTEMDNRYQSTAL